MEEGPKRSDSGAVGGASAMEGLQKRFQTEVEKFKGLEKEKQKAVQNRQQLEAQLTENTMVRDDLADLSEENTVYKKIGPTLVKQDLEEARQNVAKRIDFINAEIKKQESALVEIASKQEGQKEALQKIQTQIQQSQVKAAIKS